MDWVKLGDCFKFIRNGASIKQFGSEGLPITRIETISDRTVNKEKVGYANIKYPEYSEYYLKYNDILMSHINSESHLGKVAIYKDKTDEVIIHGMNLLCLRSNENFLADYLYYFFNSIIFKNQINKIMKKSVNQASFNITNLKDLKVPNISISKQKNIVERLAKVEILIQTRQDQVQALDDLVESTLYSFLNNERNKCELLGDIFEIKSGATPSRKNEDYWNSNDIPWVKSNQLTGEIINSAEEYISEKGYKNSSTYMFPKNTVLIAMYGQGKTRGQVGLLNIETTTNQAIAGLIPTDCVNMKFIFYQLKNMYENLRSYSQGGNQKNLSVTLLKQIKIILPPIEKQNLFAAFVEKIEKQKRILNDSLEELNDLFDSLMQDAFDGSMVK